MTGPSIAGIDVSTTAIDVVRLDLDTDEATWNRIALATVRRGDDAFTRIRRIRELLPPRTAWKPSGVCLIAIERPMSPAGNVAKGGIPLAWAYGAMLASLPVDVGVIPLEPYVWKKWSLGGGFPGQGNARKDAIATWARRNWPNLPRGVTQDGLDAYCIARATRALCEHHSAQPGGRLPTPDEILRGLRKERAAS